MVCAQIQLHIPQHHKYMGIVSMAYTGNTVTCALRYVQHQELQPCKMDGKSCCAGSRIKLCWKYFVFGICGVWRGNMGMARPSLPPPHSPPLSLSLSLSLYIYIYIYILSIYIYIYIYIHIYIIYIYIYYNNNKQPLGYNRPKE